MIDRAVEYVRSEGLPEQGFVVFYQDHIAGWTANLDNPRSWVPGCIAVDLQGNEWRACGGNHYEGAKEWIYDDPETDIPF